MVPRITVIGLGVRVRDLARSVEFYENGLSLPRKEAPEGIAFFEMSGTMLLLYSCELTNWAERIMNYIFS